jgi:hypothetical protein
MSPKLDNRNAGFQSALDGRPLGLEARKQHAIDRIAYANPQDLSRSRLGRDAGKVAILRHDDSIGVHCVSKDIRIIRFAKPNVLYVNRFMALGAQPRRDPRRQLGVDNEFHSAATITG